MGLVSKGGNKEWYLTRSNHVNSRLGIVCGITIRLTCILPSCELSLFLPFKTHYISLPCNHKSLHALKRTITPKIITGRSCWRTNESPRVPRLKVNLGRKAWSLLNLWWNVKWTTELLYHHTNHTLCFTPPFRGEVRPWFLSIYIYTYLMFLHPHFLFITRKT